jgi:uncharacterized protein YegL
MNRETTELVFILDRSGSMKNMKDEAIGGFNAFLEEQQALPDKANLTLILFDHRYKVIYDSIDIKEAKPLDNTTYVPSGTTALLDAVGRAVTDINERLDKSCPTCGCGEKNNSKVIMGILTDGLENASQDFTKKKINELINLHEKEHSWEFLFLAANQDAIKEGGGLGINATKAMNYNFNKKGIRKSYMTASRAMKQYRLSGDIKNVDIKNLVDDKELDQD